MNMHSAARFRLQSCISGRPRAKVGGASRAAMVPRGRENVNESGVVRGGGPAPERFGCRVTIILVIGRTARNDP